jgi:hypothetical protein
MTVLLLVAYVASSFLFKMRDIRRNAVIQQEVDSYTKSLSSASNTDIPNIVCWGDDFTYGNGSEEAGYPYKLNSLLTDNGYLSTAINMGLNGENTVSVLGRASAVPFVTGEFALKENPELTPITISSPAGEIERVWHKKNLGINPVTINGIEGTLFIKKVDGSDDEIEGYYFMRGDKGMSVTIPNDSEIHTDGEKYLDYINVIAIGNNGGWNTPEDLVKQEQSFVDKLGENKDKYIILGLFNGSADDNKAVDSALEKAFGEHFINIRSELVNKISDDETLSEDDKTACQNGVIPDCLREGIALNDKGNKLVAQIIFDTMEKGGYFE